jgi:hypothetical protein
MAQNEGPNPTLLEVGGLMEATLWCLDIKGPWRSRLYAS